MTRARVFCLALVAALAGVALVAAPASAVTVQVSGVVRDAAGVPVAGLTIEARQISPAPSTVTAADGTYSLQVENGVQVFLRLSGPYTGADLRADTDRFFTGGSRVENLTLPLAATARVTVKEFDGTPSVNALVRPEAPLAVTTTSTGLDLVSRLAATACYTDASGVCEFHSLRGGRIGGPFMVAGQGRPDERMETAVETPGPFASGDLVLANSFKVRGTMSFTDGSPIAGVSVDLTGEEAESTTTAPDGSYTIWSATALDHASGISLVMQGTLHDGARTSSVKVTTDTFSVTGARTQNVVLPRLATHVIEVDESTGGPVGGAFLRMGAASWWSGASAEGPTVRAVLLTEANQEELCFTAADGTCTKTVFRGGMTYGFSVTSPAGPVQNFPQVSFDSDVTRSVARLIGYATTPSAGSETGRVTGTTDGVAQTVDLGALEATPVDLPAGMQSLVGQIHYELRTGIGSAAPLTLDLPEGAHPNALLVVGPDGKLSEKTSNVEIVGNRVRFVVWDASQDDPDHTYDGIVAGTVIPVVREPLTIATTSLPAAAVGKPYTFALSGTGPVPPYSWEIPAGSLPDGLSLSRDGVISGTPTTVGSSTFTVRMTDVTGSASPGLRTFTLTVAKIAVVTASVPDAYVGSAYSTALKSTGGSFLSWKLAGGALPPGLKLASNGSLSGAPITPGTYSFQVTVTSGANTSPPQSLTLVVRPMEIATTALPGAPVGVTYSQKLTTKGGKGTLAWSVAGGALPPGLALSSAGTISGRPTTVGTFSVTVRVADQSVPKQVATRTLTITVTPMTITTSALPGAKKGVYYASKLTASGGKATLTWSIVGGALPTGLTLSATGNISGYPKAPGTWTFTVKVADSSVPKNVATRTLSITVT